VAGMVLYPIFITIQFTPKTKQESLLKHEDLFDIPDKENSLKIMPENKEKASSHTISPTMMLWDVNENSLYGIFFKIKDDNDKPGRCEMLGKPCASETEWRLLLESYMEE
jgi:hypothetical protein